MLMTPQQTIERLMAEHPNLHVMTEEHAALIASRGVLVSAGPTSHAVPAEVIRFLADNVRDDHRTIETGSGHTTVAFAALARHHTCVTIDETCVELTRQYMRQVAIPEDKVTFLVEPSDEALPRLPADAEFDFAFIDGNHGFPAPVVDWHYIDKRLKIGGILGLDNTEIRAVYDLQRFLDENRSYDLIKRLPNHDVARRYATIFYRKTRDDHRETWEQPYNLKPARRPTLRERAGDVKYRRSRIYPWD